MVFLLFLPLKTPATRVEVYQNGELVKVLSLDREQTLTVTGKYTNVITVQGGRVAITHTDCPGGDCLSAGEISRAGESIVCLPNRLILRIDGTSEDGPDAMTGGVGG